MEPIDSGNLWQVEKYTDLKNGDLSVLTPVTQNGVPDMKRSRRFFSECVVGWRGQPYPVKFEIEAKSLPEALTNFAPSAEAAGKKFLEHMEEQMLKRSLIAPANAHTPGLKLS